MSDPVPVPIVHLDLDTRRARGRAARKQVPRSAHGEWSPPRDRRDPVELIAAQEVTRVPELLPIRHERMLASPFTFYRGAAILMAADLATQRDTGLRVQACGDAHLANFGGFAAPDRQIVFDMNDFDETSPGPFEWDVKRLVTSFELAWRASNIDPKEGRRIVANTARAYRAAITEFAAMRNIELWYQRLDLETLVTRWSSEVTKEQLERFQKNVQKARAKDSLRAFDKLTEVVDGEHRIASDPPLLVPLRNLDEDPAALMTWLEERFRVYRHSLQPDRRHLLESYRIVDVARKVVGVGSVGTRCFVFLLVGRDDEDPLFIQVKEANESVLEPYAGRSGYANHGQRVVEGQRLLQAASDILLGWTRATGIDGVERDYYLRQLWDGKLSPAFETMAPETLRVFGEVCGWTLARGHARSGDRVSIAAYLGDGDQFDEAMGDFAAAYAEQNQRDFEAVAAAVRSGRLAAGPVTSVPAAAAR
jgi:uncharacterized protein (DUF2252 family)